jgi:tetratricopeptide (TPR) repeat protein
LKQAEATLFNDDLTTNAEVIPAVVEKYCQFVEQNPDAATAPDWLFKALEISVSQKDVEKSGEICDKLMKDYPDYDKTPAGMFMTASFIYEDQLRDLDKAREMYEKILADYPENELIPSVEASLRNLGKTPEELIREFEMMQMEETEE